MADTKTETRKKEHIDICIEKNVETCASPGFGDIALVHKALPGISMGDVDTSCVFLGKKINAPIIIEAMTGGAQEAARINRNLATAAEDLGIAMGVGSQRAAITDEKLWSTYAVRDCAPKIPLLGNLGAIQFAKKEYSVADAKKAVSEIGADALALHLNALQEAVQPEGDLDFGDAKEAIKSVCEGLGKPVVAKETGAGISREMASMLEKCGVAMIDVAGLGGTSFSKVESYRDKSKARLGASFADWGIPTAVSIAETCKTTKLPVIASGGIRTGIDAAKAIALGADYVGIALPLLEPATKSAKSVKDVLQRIITELKTAMFLTGAKSIEELKQKDVVITGKTREWFAERGIDTKEYANRESFEALRSKVRNAIYR